MQMMNLTAMQHEQMMSSRQPRVLIQRPPPRMMNETWSCGITQTLKRSYGTWPAVDQLKFQNPMHPSGFVSSKLKHLGRGNWKGKEVYYKRVDRRTTENQQAEADGGYMPSSVNELQYQNRLKARKFYRKQFNNNNKKNSRRFAPYAPRNTSSFIMRAKKSGGIASLVSPCPETPAVLPTPIFSPSREVLVDMAKEEWGVDGYGSMTCLIRLRSPGNEMEGEEGKGSSESDLEEHVEVERRLDHDLSRFEMVYPASTNVLENHVDDQDTHKAQLEGENLVLKVKLFLMERELSD